ncbi:MAG: acyl-CoA dehydrogenase family protein [Candidatus Caldarchaeum sp.]|uniref:Acyl-CoA dehydrogenase n=1 Tax=Caldiarchaeum subterraneum TaxID=311458 RepID=A0A7C5LBH3_CALS0
MWWLTKERKEFIELARNTVRSIIKNYDSRYWAKKDEERKFPLEFIQDVEKHGLMGVNIPEEYGGSGHGVTEVDLILEEIAASPGGVVASNAVHGGFFNNHLLVKYGGVEVKQKYLRELAKGRLRFQVFAVTEPHTGFNTLRMKTEARRDGDYYVINGQKAFISRVRHSDLGIIAARVIPYDKAKKKTEGIALFLVDLRDHLGKEIKIEEIPNNIRRPIDTNMMYISELSIPKEHLLGDELKGFYYLLEGANVERTLIAGQCISMGRYAVKRAVEYAGQRVVFPPEPIAKYQGIQFPLADAWIRLEAADALKWKALEMIDNNGEPKQIGYYSNAAKYVAAEACALACRAAVLTLGGYGYSVDMDVERLWRGSEFLVFAQISPHMVLNFVATNVLGMPRSYGEA